MSSVLNSATATGTGFSAQTNAIRDVYSAEIWFAALPVLKFDQFTTKKTELGVQPGRTIVLPKYGNIKRGGRLTEGVRMQTRGMSLSTASISVYEYGNAIGFSEYLLQTSFFDQLATASLLLGRDMAVTLDKYLRDAAVTATSTVYANGRAGRTSLVAGDKFDTRAVKDAVETLVTNHATKWGGDHYICFLHPHQGRGLRDDGDWIQASLYSGATQIYTGEIGRYEDVRFVETSVMPNGATSTTDSNGDYVDVGYSNALASGVSSNLTTIYQAIIFGEYTVGHATSLPAELRDNGVDDFGREHGLAWYAIMGEGLLENANAVMIETA